MKQVWIIDEKGFFIEDKLVSEVKEKMITVPILIGYIKPKWDGATWIEGATEEEIKKWEQSQQIDNFLEVKSNQELTEENKLLKEQVKALTEANDFQEELIVEMAALVYA